MTPDDLSGVLAAVRVHWPHSNLGLPRETLAGWGRLLGRFDRCQVDAALDELALSGREHAPPPGVVARCIVDRLLDAPEWDEAAEEIERLLGRRWLKPGAVVTVERELHPPPPPEAFSHPLVAAFAIPAWDEWRRMREADRGTFMAQQRDAYKAMRGRAQRDVGLAAVGSPRRSSLRRCRGMAGLLPGAPAELRAIDGGAS